MAKTQPKRQGGSGGTDRKGPIYPARPVKGEVDFDALRKSVMKRLSKARAYLAK